MKFLKKSLLQMLMILTFVSSSSTVFAMQPEMEAEETEHKQAFYFGQTLE